MRNKTLLIRRHLIHYWHLSNQTTFHKTTFFSHSDDEDRKIEHGKYAFLLRFCAGFGSFQAGNVDAENCSEKVSHSTSSRRFPNAQDDRDAIRERARENFCRQTHPFTSIHIPLLVIERRACMDATALLSLISSPLISNEKWYATACEWLLIFIHFHGEVVKWKFPPTSVDLTLER